MAEVLPRIEAGEPIELVDGEVVPKASLQPAHGAAQAKLAALLDLFHRRAGGSRGPGGWWIMAEVDTLYAKTEEVFRHDLQGYRRDIHPERPTGAPVKHVPQWACEVLSPANARIDWVKKQRHRDRRALRTPLIPRCSGPEQRRTGPRRPSFVGFREPTPDHVSDTREPDQSGRPWRRELARRRAYMPTMSTGAYAVARDAPLLAPLVRAWPAVRALVGLEPRSEGDGERRRQRTPRGGVGEHDAEGGSAAR